MVGGEMYTYVL